ncbi:uncharacterized protein LOC127288027 [Leptopilina boulardi]|uniref:uncharacterized protein LOC127288027 n=1 Tax=Leptopilina boulardi TaxID=63433 RepID=UPI0021F578DA|nr:uncharacterized protein LOC127288027 [Leptopilina boulardi]
MDETWNIFKLSSILQNRGRTLQWLRDFELIPSERYCTKHQKNMKLYEDKYQCGQFVCQKKNKYNHTVSVAENTWFENTHISAASCILMTYCFAINFSFEQTLRESSIIEGQQLSRETVADRFSFCREICMVALDQQLEEEGKIGGIGEIVEIDECKIGRRKYQRGRVVEGSWNRWTNQKKQPASTPVHPQRDQI